MRFDQEAWKQARREGTAPKYQFHGIQGAYTSLAEALISHTPFMDNYINGYIAELMEPDSFRELKPHWIRFCEKVAEQQATKYENRTQDYDGAWDRHENIIENLINDCDELREWIRTRILESKKDLDQEIRDKLEANDDDAANWRRWHWPTGIYSRGQGFCLPAGAIKGFCPKCHEPLSEQTIWPDKQRKTWMMRCTACRSGGSIDEIEDRYGHPFHMIPFTDLPLQDWKAGIKQLCDEAPASAKAMAGAR